MYLDAKKLDSKKVVHLNEQNPLLIPHSAEKRTFI